MKKKPYALIWILLVGATLCGCSVATPYQSSFAGLMGIVGGYDETEKDGGVWHVSFQGNIYTTRESIQTYWLYRCAELTLQKGYDGFEILSRMRLTRRNAAYVRIAAAGMMFIPMSVRDNPTINIGADIRFLRKPFTPRPPKSFDASTLKRELEVYVNGRKCEHENICPHPHLYLHSSSP